MKRKEISEETKKRMRKSHLGKRHSRETKKKISDSNKGRIFSEEHKRKISESKCGKPGPNLGRHFSKKAKRRMSAAHSGKNHHMFGKHLTEEIKKKIGDSHLGKHFSKEVKRKMAHSHIGLLKGKNNPRWKGGITPLKKQIRECSKCRNWVLSIFIRDNYTCQKCGNRGGNLHAHHIESFAQIFHNNGIESVEDAEKCEDFWNVNNGKTLCMECHNKEHKISGNK